MVAHLLTINTGSSSLKAALYQFDPVERRDLTAQIERIGLSGGRMRIADALGAILLDQPAELPDHPAALRALLDALRCVRPDLTLDAVGHRVVHGGSRYSEP